MSKETPHRVAETEFGTIRWYNRIRVDAIRLAPGVPFAFKSAEAGDDNLGAIFTAGAMLPDAGNPYPGQGPADGWQRPHVWPEGSGEAHFTTGPGGAAWVCLSNTRGHSAVVEHQQIAGTFTVPYDWGYVVAAGTVADGEEQGAAGDYFAPHNLDREISGNADLLLVR